MSFFSVLSAREKRNLARDAAIATSELELVFVSVTNKRHGLLVGSRNCTVLLLDMLRLEPSIAFHARQHVQRTT